MDSSGGDYYIWVTAYRGKSNYVMTISDASAASEDSKDRLNVADDFLTGQALVKFRDRTVKTGVSAVGDITAAASLRHLLPETTIPGRANRMIFELDRQVMESKSLAPGRRSILQAAATTGVRITAEMADKLLTMERIKDLLREPDVEFAEPNRIRQAMFTPNDIFYSQQWDFPAIHVPDAWDITDGNGVIVAVIDSGVYLNHPDLRHQLVSGYDFVSDPSASGDGDGIDDNPDDPGDGATIGASSFHGTHVAGTIAAQTDNAIGVAGIAHGAKIMPLRALGPAGGTDADIAQCIYFAAALTNSSGTVPTKRADIINMSLGGPGSSRTLQEAITAARGAGLIVVAAAGNDNSDVFFSPADEEGVIAVSAVGQDGLKASYSNFGSKIDVAAPGGDFIDDPGILSTSAKDSGAGVRAPTYKSLQGTSMASPHMAGVVALMKSVYPALTPAELDTLLVDFAVTNDIGSPGRDDLYGYGVIDALRAVQAAQQLSGGTVVSGYPTISPSAYDFGIGSDTTVLVSSDDTTVSIVQIIEETDWLTITPQSVSEAGLGTYRLQVDRTGLTPARYSATIVFVANNGKQSELQIYMSVLQSGVDSGGSVGLVYVLLLDESATESLYEVEATPDANGYHFKIDGIPAGNYRLIAGTDHDNDYLICDAGEGCGAFPTMDNTTLISVSEDLLDLDFLVHPDTQLVEKNTVAVTAQWKHTGKKAGRRFSTGH